MGDLVVKGFFVLVLAGFTAGYAISGVLLFSSEVLGQGLEADSTGRGSSIRSDFQETIGITRRDGDVFIVSRVWRLDLRQAIKDLLEGGQREDKKRADNSSSRGRLEERREESREESLLLNIDMQIAELLLPGEVVIKDVRANFIYRGYHRQDEDADILAFIQDLSDVFGRELIRGLELLTVSGKIANGAGNSDLTINVSMDGPDRKKIVIHSNDAAAMLRVKGRNYFKGGRYKLHAIWEEDDLEGEKIIGAVQIRDFYVTEPPVWIRMMSGVFSLKGFFGALNDDEFFFEKVEFPFRITSKKRDIRCRIFFSPELYLPCGTF